MKPPALLREAQTFNAAFIVRSASLTLSKEPDDVLFPSRRHAASGFLNLPSVIHHGDGAVRASRPITSSPPPFQPSHSPPLSLSRGGSSLTMTGEHPPAGRDQPGQRGE